MKNYVKEGQKLPMFGIGPKLIMTLGLLVVISIVLFVYVLKIGTVEGTGVWIFRAVGGVFFINWLILTIVLINTEEKWLLDLYGNEYAEYKKRVNRLIPWKR